MREDKYSSNVLEGVQFDGLDWIQNFCTAVVMWRAPL